MLVSLIPLFDKDMAISAYSLFTQKSNFYLNPSYLGTGQLDGAARVDGLEVIQNMGIETLSRANEVFVSVTNMSLFSDIEAQCDAAHDRLVLLIDHAVKPEPMYVERIQELRDKGYKFAIRKLLVHEFQAYTEVLKRMDYVFLNHKKVDLQKATIYFSKLFPNIKICAAEVDTVEDFERLKTITQCALFEGAFYKLPITDGQTEVNPLKVNYIELLNAVNQDDFDLTKAADIIGRDPALTISMLRMVNNMTLKSEITSIRHAAAMLGQKELKKWITTAVVDQLCSDKPNEITRLAMLRAKFAENLAGSFEMAMLASEIFLMGLFSVLDVILDQDMSEALKLVRVPKNVSEALINKSGKLAPLYDFILNYEKANWEEVSRQMILLDIPMNVLYKAYIDALVWYRLLTLGK
ncbi:MAG: HDOD domain-containing protein [Lachnospiraceae bacterium]|nr:HDOD domain-containing protein [Lachnospiraceae bacterium]